MARKIDRTALDHERWQNNNFSSKIDDTKKKTFYKCKLSGAVNLGCQWPASVEGFCVSKQRQL